MNLKSLLTGMSENVEHLVYHEDPLRKTNQGGLTCKNRNETVYVYGSENKTHCPLYYYKKYVGLLLQSKNYSKLYLRPKKNFLLSIWFCDQPYGFNKIKITVREVCKVAELEGKYTNHSLRATCASRMFQKNVPKQVIKEFTGHKSDCVHLYKLTSDHIHETASKTLSSDTTFSEKIDQKAVVKSCKKVKKESESKKEVLSYSQMILNVAKTKMELRNKKISKSRLKLK